MKKIWDDIYDYFSCDPIIKTLYVLVIYIVLFCIAALVVYSAVTFLFLGINEIDAILGSI